MLNDYMKDIAGKSIPIRKSIVKKGTLDISLVETTPVVWKGRLMRFESVRRKAEGKPYFRFTDMETEEHTPAFGRGYAFGSAHIEGDTAYAYGVNDEEGGEYMCVFRSPDLVNWESEKMLEMPDGVLMYNNSVCKGPDGYYMAIEIGGDAEMVGAPFTIIFAKSNDLLHWSLMDTGDHVYTRERYSACPVLRYSESDGKFYMIYLEGLPCHRWAPYIVRTDDFVHFELGLKNPIMLFDDSDKTVQRPEKFTPEQLHRISTAINCNNSDVDLCEFGGKTVILYSWGNQWNGDNLAEAEYDGPPDEFLHSFFAD